MVAAARRGRKQQEVSESDWIILRRYMHGEEAVSE